MKKIILMNFVFVFFMGCNTKEKFQENTIKKLYVELKKNKEFESDLTENILIEFLENVNISEIKQGKEIEKKLIFENFKCSCLDELKITYSKKNNRFELRIYEEFFEEDIDWCPETTYFFSFKIQDEKILELKLEGISG